MFRALLGNFSLVVLAYLFTLSPSHANDQYNILLGRLPGAVVVEGNCIPTPKNPAEEAKSCSKLNITRENFSVKIRFDPKNPVLPGGGVTLDTYDPPTLPQSYKFTDFTGTEATFYLNNNCNGIPGVAPTDCKALTTAFRPDGSSLAITGPGQFDIPGAVGSPIKFNNSNDIAKTPSTQQKVPTSGNVIGENGANVVYAAKCQHKYVNGVATNENIHVASDTTTVPATTYTYDGSGNLTATTTYQLENCPNNKVINNLRAGGGYAIGAVTCLVGATAQYGETVAGVVQPVRSVDCEVALDAGRCTQAEVDNQTCNPTVALMPGADVYFNGSPKVLPGIDIKAVYGARNPITISGTLYGLVFSSTDDYDFQNDINNFNAREITVSRTASATHLKTNFYVRYRGSQACVFAQGPSAGEWRVSDAYPQNLNEVYDQPEGALAIDPLNQPKERAPNAIIPDTKNCVQAPPPAPVYSMPQWNTSISPVCTNYDSSSSRFRFPDGASRAFLGVVIECIEETLLKVFVADPDIEGEISFFAVMQDRIQGAIRALMAMYIIFFGYKLIMGKSVPKRSEWMWVFLRLALVMYFAIGTGMSQLLPDMLNVSKGLSLVMMQAGSDGVNLEEAYPYCDFGSAQGKFDYPDGKEYMQLWDTIDCRISKYLGVGDNVAYPDAPQVIFVGVVSIISVGLGIPIFIFSMLFVAISLMLIMRVLYTYVMAIAALVMLVYISPLIIPAVLFETTKPIFTQWLTQLMAFWLQPVILFGFLSIMFIFIDMAMFGGNHKFEDIGGTHAYNPGSVNSDTYTPAMRITDSSGNVITNTNFECEDKTAAACQYQILTITERPWPDPGFAFIQRLYEVHFADGGVLLMAAIGKLLLIVFIAYCLVGSVENISARLVGAMGTGAASYASAAPVMGPRELMSAGATAASKVNDLSNRLSPLRSENRNAALRRGIMGLSAVKGLLSIATFGASNKLPGAIAGAVTGGASSAYGHFSGKTAQAKAADDATRSAKGVDLSQAGMKVDNRTPEEKAEHSRNVANAKDYKIMSGRDSGDVNPEGTGSGGEGSKTPEVKAREDAQERTNAVSSGVRDSKRAIAAAITGAGESGLKATLKPVQRTVVTSPLPATNTTPGSGGGGEGGGTSGGGNPPG